MPFRSAAQMRYLESQKPDVAAKFVADTKRAHGSFPHGTSHVSAADLDMYRAAVAKHYADMDLARGRHHVAADDDLAPPPVVFGDEGSAQAMAQTNATPAAVQPTGNPVPINPATGAYDSTYQPGPIATGTPNTARDVAPTVVDRPLVPPPAPPAPPPKPGDIKPGDVALAGAPGGKPTRGDSGAPGYDSAFIPAPMARGGVATIPAHEIALVDPNRIAQMGGDEALVQRAIGQKGETEAAIANEAGAAANYRAVQQKAFSQNEQDYGAKLDADFQKKTAARDAYANEVADMKVDPGRWMKNQSTANRIRFALAAALGGFAQGMHATRTNVAMDQINRYISDDLDAQQKEIEQKRGHLAQLNGALAEAYRQTGDMKAARHLAHEQLLDAFDQEQKGYALKTGSQTAIANSNLLSAQAQLHKDQQQASYYSYQPERKVAAGAVDPRIKAAEDTAKHLVEQGYAPEDARRRAYAGAGLIYAPDIGEHGKPGQSDDDKYEAYKEKILSENKQPLPRADWERANQGKAPGSLPVPQSTEWSVFHALPGGAWQGTETYNNELDQDAVNMRMTTAIINKLGAGSERSPAVLAEFGKYKIKRGDSQKSIDQKIRLFNRDYPAYSIGGGSDGGSSTGGVQVTPESGD